MTGLSVLSPSQGLLINNSYAYDNTGNITSISDLLDSSRSLTFTYDELNRLKQATNSTYGTLAYNYDQIGNILLPIQLLSLVKP